MKQGKSKQPIQLETANQLARALNGNLSIVREDEICVQVSYTKFETKREVVLKQDESDLKSIGNFENKKVDVYPSNSVSQSGEQVEADVVGKQMMVSSDYF